MAPRFREPFALFALTSLLQYLIWIYIKNVSERTIHSKQALCMCTFTRSSTKRLCLCTSTVIAVISEPSTSKQARTCLLQKSATRHLKVKKPALSNNNRSNKLNLQGKLSPFILRFEGESSICHCTYWKAKWNQLLQKSESNW